MRDTPLTQGISFFSIFTRFVFSLLWLELYISTRTILYPPSVLALFRYKGTTPLFTCSMNLDNFFKSVDEEIYLTAL